MLSATITRKWLAAGCRRDLAENPRKNETCFPSPVGGGGVIRVNQIVFLSLESGRKFNLPSGTMPEIPRSEWNEACLNAFHKHVVLETY
ncbi:hypothetical protein TNCT_667641 [Trichonephila clavata]|uniref:Uncharacterized protein n=1 Tax=Trichonephila clavata TaxID=2740835 RepID=A0A8X6L8T3_TRICU|nr:hypothetical protein TNCT_667641 [Trichonephila clavata]